MGASARQRHEEQREQEERVLQIEGADARSIQEYDPDDAYDELGAARFEEVVDDGVEQDGTVIAPADAFDTDPGIDPDSATEWLGYAYVTARNTVMKPVYRLGQRTVDTDVEEDELEALEQERWTPSLKHYAPAVAGGALALGELVLGDADLALMTGELAAGYGTKWAVFNSSAAYHAGRTSAARDARTQEQAEEMQEDGYRIVAVPDETMEDQEELEQVVEALD